MSPIQITLGEKLLFTELLTYFNILIRRFLHILRNCIEIVSLTHCQTKLSYCLTLSLVLKFMILTTLSLEVIVLVDLFIFKTSFVIDVINVSHSGRISRKSKCILLP